MGHSPPSATQLLFDELKARNLIHGISEGLPEHFQEHPEIVYYCGFDPTAPSLHVGNLLPLKLMAHISLYFPASTPIAVVGGGTALIGDPSGKDQERPLLPAEVIEKHAELIARQLERLLSPFSSRVTLVNNREWLEPLRLIPFLRDFGKHISVNYMLAKESVQKRLSGGISFTEFTYMLLQAYDYLHLYRTRNCTLQTGGADQWGNITTGIELIRRIEGGTAHALTTPLLTRSDGSKFGKTAGGENIWLDPERTSPFAFYQYWMRLSDRDALRFLPIFSFRNLDEIQQIHNQHQEEPHRRIAQETLAYDVTQWVHGEPMALACRMLSRILYSPEGDFQTQQENLREFLDRFQNLFPEEEISREIRRFRDLPLVQLSAQALPVRLFDLLHRVFPEAVPSRSEWKRSIRSGAIRVNGVPLLDPDFCLDLQHFGDARILMVQKGKRERIFVILDGT